MEDFAPIFKAYDVRGLFPQQINTEVARSIGESWARLIKRNEPETKTVIIGRDMRPSGQELVLAFSQGVNAQDVDVIDIGLCSTDMLYFASGHLLSTFSRTFRTFFFRIEFLQDVFAFWVTSCPLFFDFTS